MTLSFLFLSIAIAGLIIVGALLIKILATLQKQTGREEKLEELKEHLEKHREALQQKVDKITDRMTDGMRSQFAQSSTLIKDVTEKLTKLDETNKRVLNFSEQLKELESVLKQPKGKGILSEYWLETMLGHVLQPGQYEMQYKFTNGEIVDAVVFFQEKIIPIDAKFSSEKYNAIVKEKDEKRLDALEKSFKQDLKLRIDETAKYIRPQESTTDFAFMFLPAEGIFYDLLINSVGTADVNQKSLIEYAFSKRVVIVSPATFFAYLQTVLQGLKAFKMDESVHEIRKNVEQLGRHMNSYESFFQKVGIHLGTTVSMYNQAYDEFRKVDKDIYKLSEGKIGGEIDPLLIEKPAGHLEESVESSKTRITRKLIASQS